MALTTPHSNNKKVDYTKIINKEYVKGNRFSPYIGTGDQAIIRNAYKANPDAEQINVKFSLALSGAGTGTGRLAGNEEAIQTCGQRIWPDYARHAVRILKSEARLDDGTIQALKKPALKDWGNEIQRDEIIQALMALPSTEKPVGNNDRKNYPRGQRVNGILYEEATVSELNAWHQNNEDRILYGQSKSNYASSHAASLANLSTVNDRMSKKVGRLAKRLAARSSPKIRPYMGTDYEGYVCFLGQNAFRDLKNDLESNNVSARPRDVSKNPIFQDGNLIDDKIIYVEVTEISEFVDTFWTSLKTAGASNSKVEPYFLCGKQAITWYWGQKAIFTRDTADYGFENGQGIEMCYGIAKNFFAEAQMKQWGVLTGFVSAPDDE